MMMPHSPRGAVAFLATVAIVGCGDEPPPRQLTMNEAMAMLMAVYDTRYKMPDYESIDSVVIACQGGGRMSVAFALDVEETDTLIVADHHSRMSPRECWVRTARLDEFMVDGDLANDVDMIVWIDPLFAGTASGSISGTLDWLLGEDAGTCEVSMVFEEQELPDDGSPLDAKYSGKLCGHELEVVLTWHYW